MPVKKIVLLISLHIFILAAYSQNKPSDYDKDWKRIDLLINKNGQTKTALKEVNTVFDKAKKEKNEPQTIKALLYRMTLNEQLSENAAAENINGIEKEIPLATQPARSILYSIAAGYYWSYLQRNRYKFYGRTTIQNDTNTDVATSDLASLNKKIASLYQSSIIEESLLQKTRLEPFDAIIIKGNTRNLRPTLFDLLAHRALDYFKNDERNISRPAYAFEISDSLAFADAKDFAAHDFKTDDTASLQYRALQLFQRLIALHQNDQDPAALIDVDIERLQFVNQYAVLENKEEWYQPALEKLIAKYPDEKTTQAMYLLASLHSARAHTYDPVKDTANRYENIVAKELCERALKTADTTEGRINCADLLKELLRKEVHIAGETVNVPGTPFRVLLNYRNFTKGYFRIVKMDKKIKEKTGTDSWNDPYWQQLLQLPAYTSKEYSLPATNDYQDHRVEIALDALPVGEYALIGSSDKNFALKGNALAVQYFYVSDIAYLNNGGNYYVVSRSTGAPLAAAKVNLWQQAYTNQSKRYLTRLSTSFTTDRNGFFSFNDSSKVRQGQNYFLDISHGTDHLFLDRQGHYYYKYEEEENANENGTSYLFTDRSIYRPGQTVYFKGIVIKKEGKNKSSVMAGRKSTVMLYDANSNAVDSLTLTTSEFGSYSGKFVLPANLLNGNFRIEDKENKSDINFNVEEYKRPKFEVAIQQPAGSYRVNDSIHVEGNARSYAGNTIDGATVKYRVVRNTMRVFMAEYSPRIWPPLSGEPVEIAHGTATTDKEGKFTIPFQAIPDKKIPKKNEPFFTYAVTAEVTDINGETRTAETTVSVGYHAVKLNLNEPASMRLDSFKVLNISSTNMNGVFEKAKVDIVISKLSTPSRIFRERLWEQPDQFILAREEFYKKFPFDLYKDEDDMSKWPEEKKLINASFTTSENDSFALPGKISAPGWYAIKLATKDKYDDTISVTRYIHLYSDKVNSPLATVGIDGNKTVAQPGDKIDVHFVTNMDSIYLIREVLKQNEDPERSVVPPSSSKNPFQLQVSEADLGQLAVNIAFVKNNRIYSSRYEVSIPFYTKQLKIDYLSFRDKTLPGVSEKWKVKISGYHAEKAAAEVLTAMYDASLDQFASHSWNIPPIWNTGISYASWSGGDNFLKVESTERNNTEPPQNRKEKIYDRLITNDGAGARIMIRGTRSLNESVVVTAYGIKTEQAFDSVEGKSIRKERSESVAVTQQGIPANAPPAPAPAPAAVVTARKNLNETAFFFPALYTDSAGNIEFTFTTPEALTQWKWMLLAHTKDLAFGYSERTMVTQKQLMVQPNPPRFLRQGDQLELNAKLVNMSSKEISGEAGLQLTDALTGEAVDMAFGNNASSKTFTVAAGQSVAVFFPVTVPDNYNHPITWKIIASASLTDSTNTTATVSDGEESILPVISNRMLVTETMPLPVKSNTTKTFDFAKLLKSGSSNTLQQSGLTLEFTSNPAWYAVQALPYLMEGEKENAEAVFNRFYANALASTIADSSPRFREIMEKWKITDTAALMSNLQKNEELKSLLLQETPWVLEAKNEAQQKRNIALLFEFYTLSKNIESALGKLQDMQSPSGAFEWYKGGPGDRYMTQYIVTGIGRLQKLKAVPAGISEKLNAIAKPAISYLDQQLKNDYNEIKDKKNKVPGDYVGQFPIQYLYMRSLFPETGVPGDVFPAYNYYRNLSKTLWVRQNTYMRGMIALSLFRTGNIQNAKKVMTGLKENAIENDELGMYWKDMSGGYYWYEAPVESQALMIEAFTEISKDTNSVNNMKTWLLKNKQTNSWKTSKATADACYALLLQGSDWISPQPVVNITLGDTAISSSTEKTEAGTGYFKTKISGEKLKPEMGKISVTVKTAEPGMKQPSWGAVYWQYFENLNKITSSATPLQLNKKLFIEKNTDHGPTLEPIGTGNTLRIGDKIKVRIELRSDRTMEYVHMKDMRASCMEPVNVLSSYKYQGGLGYYESTKDAATNFYFGVLPKGIYVFEYNMVVTHSGSFSNGITTIQCMYAPEFTSHSEGINVKVGKQ